MAHTTKSRADVNRPTDGPMVRPQEGRVIAGVAQAVANRLGMSPGAVRLVWFILGFFGGLGLLLYIAGWLLIPEEDAEQSIAENVTERLTDSTKWLGIALITIAAVTLVAMLDWVRADLAWAVALLAVGVLMYRGHLGTTLGRGDGSAATDSRAADVGEDQVEEAGPLDPAGDVEAEPVVDEGGGAPVRPVATEERPPPRSRRDKSILSRLTIGTVFISLGLMALLDTSNVIRPAFSHYMAVAVGIIGIGLLIGSVYGRSRGLIFAGIVLVPIMLAGSVVTAGFDGGWGDPVFRPTTVNDVDDHYTLTGGDLQIDLRRIDPGNEVLTVEGDVGFGRMLVIVPAGIGLDIDAHVGFGDLQLFGDHNGGIDVDRSLQIDGVGLIELDLDVGIGALEIRQVPR